MLEVRNISRTYRSGFWNHRKVEAVSGASFTIYPGEIFGIIGESGCGKTTLSRIIAGLLVPSAGQVFYNGEDITHASRRTWRTLRKEIQVVFQNPQMTFNPRSTVYNACLEPIRNYHLASGRVQEQCLVEEMLSRVGITPDQMHKYPHEISGGQAQRVSIARTLILRPRLLICDEPTSMLDISVQAQVMSLLRRINQEDHLAILFISHNLDIIQALCDRVAVMNRGKILETGSTDEVFTHPGHEYTRKLLSARLGNY